MLLDVILYTVLTIFSIILFFTYINPIIRENISGIKGALLSLSIILAVILPFLWAIIMKKNHSPEFQKLWNDSKYNRGPLVSLIAIKILLCASILMPVIVHILKRGIRCRIYCYPVWYWQWLSYPKNWKSVLSRSRKDLLTTSTGKQRTQTLEVLWLIISWNLCLSMICTWWISLLAKNPPLSAGVWKRSTSVKKYGINIVSIIRGERQINIPRGEERLYPFDKIIIVGTDEELDLFQEIIQKQDKEYRDQLAQSFNNNIKIEQF